MEKTQDFFKKYLKYKKKYLNEKKNTIKKTLIKLINEHLKINESEENYDKYSFAELGADSLDSVELIMVIEEHFNIEIPDDDAANIYNLNKAIEYIFNKKN
tara:strand:- start:399 stop:701 length:303 start_codon:yes stop_codon:yes gene_type:complete